jgi:hypothetical protein
MMARSMTLQSKAGYIHARPLTTSLSKSSCSARPDHTFGSFSTEFSEAAAPVCTENSMLIDLVTESSSVVVRTRTDGTSTQAHSLPNRGGHRQTRAITTPLARDRANQPQGTHLPIAWSSRYGNNSRCCFRESGETRVPSFSFLKELGGGGGGGSSATSAAARQGY